MVQTLSHKVEQENHLQLDLNKITKERKVRTKWETTMNPLSFITMIQSENLKNNNSISEKNQDSYFHNLVADKNNNVREPINDSDILKQNIDNTPIATKQKIPNEDAPQSTTIKTQHKHTPEVTAHKHMPEVTVQKHTPEVTMQKHNEIKANAIVHTSIEDLETHIKSNQVDKEDPNGIEINENHTDISNKDHKVIQQASKKIFNTIATQITTEDSSNNSSHKTKNKNSLFVPEITQNVSRETNMMAMNMDNPSTNSNKSGNQEHNEFFKNNIARVKNSIKAYGAINIMQGKQKIMQPLFKQLMNNKFTSSEIGKQLQSFILKSKMLVKDKDNAMFSAQLYPKELGKISMKLSLVDGSLNGNFLVENTIVQKELLGRMETLLNHLKEDGYDIKQFDVNLDNSNNELEHHTNSNQKQNENNNMIDGISYNLTNTEEIQGGLYA